MEYNCSYYNTTPPKVAQQLDSELALAVSIGGAIISAFLLALFIFNLFTNIRRSPAITRRCLAWITSIPMVVSFLSLVVFIVPRTGDTLDTVKQLYMPFVLQHFIEMTLVIANGEKAVIDRLIDSGTKIKFCSPPCCYFGLCFKKLTFNKLKFRILNGLVYQAPIAQFIVILLMFVLDKAEILQRQSNDALFQILSIVNMIAFMLGLWSYNIIVEALRIQVETRWRRFWVKSKVVGVFVAVLKLQHFVLGIVSVFGAMPCIPPVFSSAVLKRSIDATLSMIDALVFGIVFFVTYVEDGSTKRNLRLPDEILPLK